MTLMEHLYELRSRLFKASLGIVVGFAVGLWLAPRAWDYLIEPYCTLRPAGQCQFSGAVLGDFLVKLRLALYLGLMLAAPIWLYQLWAFIAPGLHKRERRYTYAFVGVAAPLFLAGAVLANFIIAKSLEFLLSNGGRYTIVVDLPGYFEFVTNIMLLFGLGFEFPVVVVMLNFAGVVSARRLLSWWRVAIFLMFVFGAIVTPTPDPFGMTALAAVLSLLYFAAVGVAFINDARRRRRRREAEQGSVADDEVSPLAHTVEPVDEAGPLEVGRRTGSVDPSGPVRPSDPVGPSGPVGPAQPLDSRYDDDAT